jgi:hypothetical protein
MVRQENEKTAAGSQEIYQPPRVVKISDLKQGEGLCSSGSGDAGCCNNTGNSAVQGCSQGNSTTGHCFPGNSAVPVCPGDTTCPCD